ncbi:hypothetical protein BGX26_000748 [Mortierella sp. AD094]|nr:hypothetical protein BGX26_000748 [Mortierella sp. AD094]
MCLNLDPIIPEGFYTEDESLPQHSSSAAQGTTANQIIDEIEDFSATSADQNKEAVTTRAGVKQWMFDETLLKTVMDKCPVLSTFSVSGFPFDNDQAIWSIADRLGPPELVRNATVPTSTSSSLALAQPQFRGLKKLELTSPFFCHVILSTIEYLLDHRTPELEELVLYGNSYDSAGFEYEDEEDDIEQSENSNTTAQEASINDSGEQWRLWKLVIRGIPYRSGALAWRQLLWRCSQLQEIHLDLLWHGALQQLAQALSLYCPKISDITLQLLHGRQPVDSHIADLIQASRSLKSLTMAYFSGFGSLSAAALIKHSTILETLVLEECDGLSSQDIQSVLCSCANLKTLRVITSSGMTLHSTMHLDANDMVDSSWACLNLENLHLVIKGVARPDLQVNQYGLQLSGPLHDGTITGFDLQRTVYNQLGKLTKLQQLWLGQENQDMEDDENYHETGVPGEVQYIDPDEQFECLEFSLESGLDLLQGLKGLKVLSLERLKTRIGLPEVQWMVKQWPKLESIFGLGIEDEDIPEHVQWLYDNRPDIKLPLIAERFLFEPY